MIKIVIVTPQWNSESMEWTEDLNNKIHEWFTLNSFEIPFIPTKGMMIDLDDFFDFKHIDIQEEQFVNTYLEKKDE